MKRTIFDNEGRFHRVTRSADFVAGEVTTDAPDELYIPFVEADDTKMSRCVLAEYSTCNVLIGRFAVMAFSIRHSDLGVYVALTPKELREHAAMFMNAADALERAGVGQ